MESQSAQDVFQRKGKNLPNKKATRRWLFCSARKNYLEAAEAAASAAGAADAASAAGAAGAAEAAGAGAATGAGAGAGAGSSFLPQAARAAAAITAANTRVLFICVYLIKKDNFRKLLLQSPANSKQITLTRFLLSSRL
jgi:hypothetical protein